MSMWRDLSSLVYFQEQDTEATSILAGCLTTKICSQKFVDKFLTSCSKWASQNFSSKLRVSYSPCASWAIDLCAKLESVLKYAFSSYFIDLLNGLESEAYQVEVFPLTASTSNEGEIDGISLRIDVAILWIGSQRVELKLNWSPGRRVRNAWDGVWRPRGFVRSCTSPVSCGTPQAALPLPLHALVVAHRRCPWPCPSCSLPRVLGGFVIVQPELPLLCWLCVLIVGVCVRGERLQREPAL